MNPPTLGILARVAVPGQERYPDAAGNKAGGRGFMGPVGSGMHNFEASSPKDLNGISMDSDGIS